MFLEYYKGNIPNFGDDLNPFLWKTLFPNQFINNDGIGFVGVGSVIDQRLDQSQKKIIFGAGIRDLTLKYDLKNWEVFFVRGPITANILGGVNYITDAAYFLHFHPIMEEVKKIKKEIEIGIIPHFFSKKYMNWERLNKENKFLFIDPSGTPEEVIKKIASCRYIITEAMHGAIVADILRIPWRRFKFSSFFHETDLVSEVKWTDWLSSIKMENNYRKVPFFISSKEINYKGHIMRILQNKLIKRFFRSGISYQLSKDEVIAEKYKELECVMGNFKQKYI